MGNIEDVQNAHRSTGQQAASTAQPQPPAATVPLPPPPPPPPMAVQVGTRDARGIERGGCTRCPNCAVYSPQAVYDEYRQPMISVSSKCVLCGCPPGAHKNLTTRQAWSDTSQPMNPQSTVPASSMTDVNDFVMVPDSSTPVAPVVPNCLPTVVRVCAFPQCGQSVEFDANTGIEFAYCSDHINYTNTMAYAAHATDLQVENVDFQDAVHVPYGHPIAQPALVTADPSGWQQPIESVQQFPPMAPLPVQQQQLQNPLIAPPTSTPTLPSSSGVPKCAIPECPNPCHVDDSGKVHDCCGYSHAMEYLRRQTIQQQQQMVKGVTHCLLPECSNPTWPFQNYCGRTHADIGIQRGLIPPAPQVDPNAAAQDKDSSLCIITGCNRKKYVDGGKTHDYCGKTHAQQGKQMGILPTAEREEDQCELPGCTRPKRKEGDRTHNYCCRDHATQDAPNRDARMLTSFSEVQKFLNGFSNLKVASIVENLEAKPGGTLFERFKSKMLSLPKNQRNTKLAFHGTAESNISSICKKGYDPGLRTGQAYGAGEYFATTPDIPLGYCKGGKKMLLNELLLGQAGTHHTQHGSIIVMKDPAHDLPRFIITFK